METQLNLNKWNVVKEESKWTPYNRSQTSEKSIFLRLLGEICKTLEGEAYMGKGRKPRPTADMIFCMCLKVFLGTSSRRLISDLQLCKRLGYIDFVPHFNSVSNFFNSNVIKRNLQYLIGLSALPLGQLEDKFAADSTGFSERKYMDKWSSVRQNYSRHRKYKKAHCIYGVYSNIVASVTITDGTGADSPQFKRLLENAAKNFNILEVTADKAYSSRDNLQCAADLGIVPFIPFKKNTRRNSRGCDIWKTMYTYFKNNREDFMSHYHLRSNAESGFFMIKQKFGSSVNHKIPLAQTNEILCKVLCHNICVLVQEMFLSKIEIDFSACAKTYSAQEYD